QDTSSSGAAWQFSSRNIRAGLFSVRYSARASSQTFDSVNRSCRRSRSRPTIAQLNMPGSSPDASHHSRLSIPYTRPGSSALMTTRKGIRIIRRQIPLLRSEKRGLLFVESTSRADGAAEMGGLYLRSNCMGSPDVKDFKNPSDILSSSPTSEEMFTSFPSVG